jgi:hypothetical protein
MKLKKLAEILRTPIGHKVWTNPKVRHTWTNLDNEITDLTPKKTDWLDIFLCVAVGLVIAWIVIEYVIGADNLLAWVEAM